MRHVGSWRTRFYHPEPDGFVAVGIVRRNRPRRRPRPRERCSPELRSNSLSALCLNCPPRLSVEGPLSVSGGHPAATGRMHLQPLGSIVPTEDEDDEDEYEVWLISRS